MDDKATEMVASSRPAESPENGSPGAQERSTDNKSKEVSGSWGQAKSGSLEVCPGTRLQPFAWDHRTNNVDRGI